MVPTLTPDVFPVLIGFVVISVALLALAVREW
jgi:hypothetical protein